MAKLIDLTTPISDLNTTIRVGVLFEWTMDNFGESSFPPDVRTMDHNVMAERTAFMRPDGMTTWGWYCFQYPNNIFLSSQLELNTSRFAQCILVHEMVHYLQQHSVKYQHIRPFGFEHVQLLEDEANRIMNLYNSLVMPRLA